MSILAGRARRLVAHDNSSIEKFRDSRACFTELDPIRFRSPWFAHRTKHRVCVNNSYNNNPLFQPRSSAKQHVRTHYDSRYGEAIRQNQSAPPLG